jgi:hypothetical protein
MHSEPATSITPSILSYSSKYCLQEKTPRMTHAAQPVTTPKSATITYASAKLSLAAAGNRAA